MSNRERLLGIVLLMTTAFFMGGADLGGNRWYWLPAVGCFFAAYLIAANHFLIKPIRAKHEDAMRRLRDADPARDHERIDP